MKSATLRILLPGLLCVMLLAGCKSTDTAKIGSLASIEITGHSLAEVRQSVVDVFLLNGYSQKSGLTFEKQGTNWDTVAYGTWSGGAVWYRMKASVIPRPGGACVVACDAYLIRDHGEGFMEEEQRLVAAKRDDCMKLLEEVRSRLNPGESPPAAK